MATDIYDGQQQIMPFVNATSTAEDTAYLSNLTATTITNYINKSKYVQPFNYHHTIATVALSDGSGTNGGHQQTVDGIINFRSVSDETTSTYTAGSSFEDNVVKQFNVNASAIFYNGFRNFSAPTTDTESGIRDAMSTDGGAEIDSMSDGDWIILHWTELLLVCLMCGLIVITVIGNTLVILSVLTTRRLRTVTNCFVMSLAVADWLVGLFVMPPAVAVHLIGRVFFFLNEFISYICMKK